MKLAQSLLCPPQRVGVPRRLTFLCVSRPALASDPVFPRSTTHCSYRRQFSTPIQLLDPPTPCHLSPPHGLADVPPGHGIHRRLGCSEHPCNVLDLTAALSTNSSVNGDAITTMGPGEPSPPRWTGSSRRSLDSISPSRRPRASRTSQCSMQSQRAMGTCAPSASVVWRCHPKAKPIEDPQTLDVMTKQPEHLLQHAWCVSLSLSLESPGMTFLPPTLNEGLPTTRRRQRYHTCQCPPQMPRTWHQPTRVPTTKRASQLGKFDGRVIAGSSTGSSCCPSWSTTQTATVAVLSKCAPCSFDFFHVLTSPSTLSSE